MTYKFNGALTLEKDPEVAGNLLPCGTPAAARRHYLRGERPCEPCREAERNRWTKASLDRRGKAWRLEGFTPEKCGTNAGYARHYYYRLEPCAACKEAHRDYHRDLRAKRRANK